jgi:hypothetical protein
MKMMVLIGTPLKCIMVTTNTTSTRFVRVPFWYILLLVLMSLPWNSAASDGTATTTSTLISTHTHNVASALSMHIQVDASNTGSLHSSDNEEVLTCHNDKRQNNMDVGSTSIEASLTSEPGAILTPFTTAETDTLSTTTQSSTANTTISSIWTGECGLWLAPSTLEGAGLGMYAGRDFEPHEAMQVTGDVVIPIVDLPHHLPPHVRERDYIFLWDEYTWNAEILSMHWDGHWDVHAASPGFGSAANSFLPLVNVDEHSVVQVDTAGLHRSTDPGVGAFTPYHNRRSTAKTQITAGQELFVDYGDHWFITRKSLGPIPRTMI